MPGRVSTNSIIIHLVHLELETAQAKYVMMIELVETLSGTAGGKGGYWEDDQGCEWYAGI